MKRFADFILIDREALKKSKKESNSTVNKARDLVKALKKEKLAGPGDFMNDPSLDATNGVKKEVPVVSQNETVNASEAKKAINFTNKSDLKSYNQMKKDKK